MDHRSRDVVRSWQNSENERPLRSCLWPAVFLLLVAAGAWWWFSYEQQAPERGSKGPQGPETTSSSPATVTPGPLVDDPADPIDGDAARPAPATSSPAASPPTAPPTAPPPAAPPPLEAPAATREEPDEVERAVAALRVQRAEEPMRVGGDVRAPIKIQGADPEYTEIARNARIQGVVIVQVVIDKQGKVGEVQVLKGLPMGLDQKAVEAVRTWTFQPATLNGEPVAVYYNLNLNFQLDS